ncbi:MAG TPA: hypothetical protein VER17_19655, partial [Tepidisphaeraceae bacterium]|nr:hypothetical protein [Tepidisphaeraceae bacterium]
MSKSDTSRRNKGGIGGQARAPKASASRTIAWAAAIAVAASAGQASAATLLYNWNFNDPTTGATTGNGTPATTSGGGTLTLTNSATGPGTANFAAVGPSAAGGDFAYDGAGTNNVYGGPPSGIATTAAGDVATGMSSLQSLTVTFWMKAPAGFPHAGTNARFVMAGPAATYDQGANGFHVSLNSGDKIQKGVNGFNPISGNSLSTFLPANGMATNDWVFVAYAYDGDPTQSVFFNNNIRAATGNAVSNNSYVYVGAKTTTPVLFDGAATLATGNTNPGPVNLGANAFAMVGNRSNLQRSFLGQLDNVRIYNGLLSRPELEQTRRADLGIPLTFNSEWKVNGDGNWLDANMWNGVTAGSSVPNGPDTATLGTFGGAVTGARTVTLNGAVAVSTLNLDNPAGYTVNGTATNKLTLDVTTGSAAINVVSGDHTINAPLTFADTAAISVAAASKLTINSLSIENLTVNKTGAGTLEVNRVFNNTLAVNGGTVKITPNGTPTGTTRLFFFNDFGTGGQLDLTNNKLIIANGANGGIGTLNGATYTGLSGLIQKGRAGGTWNGRGITTSQADALSGLTALGSATAAQIGKLAGSTWNGNAINANDVLAMYTYGGDANLDGKLNGDDYFQLDNGFAAQSGPNAATTVGWFNGDFNYDGRIDGDDYFLLDRNINQQTAGLILTAGGIADTSAGLTAVPEPAGLGLAAAVLTLTAARRRRR